MLQSQVASDLFLQAFQLTTTYADDECPEDVWPLLTRAEEMVLQHRPRTFVEAAAILEAILIQPGERCDNLDRDALVTLRAFLLERAGATSIDELHGDRRGRAPAEVVASFKAALAA